MTIASAAVRGAQRPLYMSALPPRDAAPESVRDEMTHSRLLATVEHLPGLVVESFERDWWDGQVHVPCIVVRTGRHLRRMRVVETDGACVVVPFSRRLASRLLAARRQPRRRPELGLVVDRRPSRDVVVHAWNDAVRCATRSCGVLRPVGYPGCCPVCGG